MVRGLLESARGDVDTDASDVAIAHLDLARMDGCPDVEPQLDERLAQPERAAECAGGRVERGQDAIAGGLDELAVPSAHLRPRHLVVVIQQLAPSAIAQSGGAFGGADDI